MAKYTDWASLGPHEEAISSARMSGEALAAVPSLAGLSAPARRDAALAELLANQSVRKTFEEYGALGDGVTDDSTSINAAFAAGGFYDGGFKTYLCGSALMLSTAGTYVTGFPMFKAAPGATFETLLSITAASDVVLDGLSLNANGANRTPQSTGFRCLLANTVSRLRLERIFATNSLGPPSGSDFTVGVATCTDVFIDRVLVVEGGTVSRPCDGIYIGTSTNVVIGRVVAKNCYDTAVVFESCTNVSLTNWVSDGCRSGLGISVLSAADCGNINCAGGIISNWNASVTGGISITSTGSTNNTLRNVSVSDVVMERSSGDGPAVYVRKGSSGTGYVDGVTLGNLRIKGAGTHGVIIEGHNVLVQDCEVENITGAGASCITVLTGGWTNAMVRGGVYRHDANGVIIAINAGAVDATVENATLIGDGTNSTWGVYYFGSQTRPKALWNDIRDTTIGAVGGDNPVVSAMVDGLNNLAITGALRCSGSIGVGNSAAATTPGSIVKKIEVFDTAGVSLGFVPVYDAIT